MNFPLLLDSTRHPNQTSHDFFVTCDPPINFKYVRHELAVESIFTWFSFFNILPQYNTHQFSYSSDNGATWNLVTIPSGNYSVEQLEKAIHDLLPDIGVPPNVTKGINLLPNYSTLKLYIELAPNYQIDLTAGSLAHLLGFNNAIITGSQYGPRNINITNDVNSFNLHCDLVTGSTIDNGTRGDVIYSFIPNVRAGASLIIKPNERLYIPISSIGAVSRIRLYLTDQNNRTMDLQGEALSVLLHIRQIKE